MSMAQARVGARLRPTAGGFSVAGGMNPRKVIRQIQMVNINHGHIAMNRIWRLVPRQPHEQRGKRHAQKEKRYSGMHQS